MLKLSKPSVIFVSALGLMVTAQVGLGLYGSLRPKTEETSSYHSYQAGAAIAFGLVAPERHFQVNSVDELDNLFQNANYNLNAGQGAREVPRLYLTKLPKDMTKKKKSTNKTFVQVLLPHILQVNEKILADRKRLVELRDQCKTRHLRHTEKMWLMKLASDYRCKSTKIDALLMHVDIVPPSLALAQATIETGGGRSSAALRKNSTFGHMTRDNKVMHFESLQKNVEAYVHNLNRHQAYAGFRKVRADLRTKNQPLCGIQLAACLEKYSIRRAAYIREVQGLIRNRDLRKYDAMTLKQMHLKP